MPRVSLLLPAYNDLDYLKMAIDTGLKQTFEDFELIVVNDGSTDGTREYLDQLEHPKLKVFHKENGGCYDALNAGLREASGELVSWISSDNLSPDYFLEALVAALDSCPGAKLAYGAYFNIDDRGEIINVNQNNHQFPHELITTTHRGNAAFMYYRECHDKVGNYIDSYSCDTDMWLKLSSIYATVYVMEPLYFYRMHNKRATSGLDEKYYYDTTEQIWDGYKSVFDDASLLGTLYGYPTLNSSDNRYFLAANDLATRFASKQHLNIAMSLWKLTLTGAPVGVIKLVAHNMAQTTALFPKQRDKISSFFAAHIKQNKLLDGKSAAKYIKRFTDLSKDALEDGASDFICDKRWLDQQNATRLHYFSYFAWKQKQMGKFAPVALTSTP